MQITVNMKSLPSITTYFSYCYVRRRDLNLRSVILVRILISGLDSLIIGKDIFFNVTLFFWMSMFFVFFKKKIY